MEKKFFKIREIPAVLWGPAGERCIIAVHGKLSHKTDVPIEVLAEVACPKGYQVLSFDLPEHGDRIQQTVRCSIENCIQELYEILGYVKQHWERWYVFGNSLGAYFSLCAYEQEHIERAWFLSPLVDMERMIKNMMQWSGTTEEQLQAEQVVKTSIGETLHWKEYCFVKENPVMTWEVPTFLLCGEKDEICERDTIERFAEKFQCDLEIVPQAEHYFHTPEQMEWLRRWLEQKIV